MKTLGKTLTYFVISIIAILFFNSMSIDIHISKKRNSIINNAADVIENGYSTFASLRKFSGK